MKKFGILLILALVILSLSCSPDVSGPIYHVGGNASAEQALITEANDKIDDVIDGSQPLTIGFSIGSLYNTTNQVISFNTNYPIDESTIEEAISFYRLQSATSADALCERFPNKLPYTYTIKPEGDGSRVFLTLNLTYATATIEYEVLASLLSGFNGSKKLDTDNDQLMGEENRQDDMVGTLAVGTNSSEGANPPDPVAVVRVLRPQDMVTFLAQGALAGPDIINPHAFTGLNRFSFLCADTGPDGTHVDLRGDDEKPVAKIYFSNNGDWVDCGIANPSYDADNYLATLPFTQPWYGFTYKIVVDKYEVRESEAVLGLVHRASNDTEGKAGDRYLVFYKYFHTYPAQQTFESVTADGSDYNRYIDITVADADTPINMNTVTPKSLKVRLSANTLFAGGKVGTDYYPSYSVAILQTINFGSYDSATRRFRLYLPSTIKSLVAGENRLEIAPSVVSLNDDPHTTAGRRSFGDVSNVAGDAWRWITF